MLNLISAHLPQIIHFAEIVFVTLALVAMGTITNRSHYNMNPDDRRRIRKQRQGGHIFNDILRQMRQRNERMLEHVLDKLTESELSEDTRMLAAKVATMCHSDIADISQMMEMKEPEPDDED